MTGSRLLASPDLGPWTGDIAGRTLTRLEAQLVSRSAANQLRIGRESIIGPEIGATGAKPADSGQKSAESAS
jgi:hypothetical protein